MFERFTENARQVVILAQDQARTLGHNSIGPEHILLGLLADTGGSGCRTLNALGVELAAVRGKIETFAGRGNDFRVGAIPFTRQAKRILEQGLRAALRLGDNFIGSEHLLLAIIRQGEGLAYELLLGYGVEEDAVTAEIAHQREIGRPEPVPETLPRRPPQDALGVELEAVKQRLIAAQRFEDAARLKALQRQLELLVDEIGTELARLADD